MNKLIAGILVFSLAGAATLSAASSGASFLKINHSARSYALGDSGVVNALGAEAIGSNPGNLMNMGRKMEVLSAYTSMTEGVSYAHIGGAINRSVKKDLMVDAVGFSYTRLAVDGIEGRDRSGAKTTDFKSQDNQMSFSLGGNVGKMKIGATGKMVQSKIGEFKANTVFAADLGASYSFKRFGKEMKAGMAINNLGQGMKYLNQKDPLPTSMNLGLTADAGIMNLTGGMNHNLKGSGTQMALGMEMNFGIVSLRAGVNALGGTKGNKTSGTTGIFEGLSSGIGLNLGNARVDYAVGQNSADLGISHRMSLTLQFGRKAN